MKNTILLLVLSIRTHKAVTSVPCSNLKQTSSVIDICSSRTVVEDSTYKTILLQVTTTEECQCSLSITEHIQPIKVKFKKYDGNNSVPSSNNCGVELYLKSFNGIFKESRCEIFDIVYAVPTGRNVSIFTRTTPTGSLSENGDYCLKILIDVAEKYNPNIKLRLICNNSSDDLQTDETKTTLFGNTTTSVSFQKSGSNPTLYVAIGAACGGILLVCIIAMVVIFKKRITKSSDDKNAQGSTNAKNVDECSADELQYNILYQPSTCLNVKSLQSQKGDTNEGIDSHYSDIDVFQKGKTVSDKQNNILETEEIENTVRNLSEHKRPHQKCVYSITTDVDNGDSIDETTQTKSNSDMKNSYLYAVVNKIKTPPVSESSTN